MDYSGWLTVIKEGSILMVTKLKPTVLSIVFGIILSAVYPSVNAFSTNMKNIVDLPATESRLASEKAHSLFPKPVVAHNGLADPTQVSPRYLSEEACSTDIVLAVFFKSRYCRTGTLIVAATSKFMGEANLELLDYGPMTWHRTNQMWLIRVRDLERNPSTATIEGAECTVQVQVVTVPFGCDARMHPDISKDS
jgi:hypothetical protein